MGSAAKTNLSGGVQRLQDVLRCFAQAYKTGHRWRFFRSFQDSFMGTQPFFRVNSAMMKLEQIFSLTNTLQSLKFHLPK